MSHSVISSALKTGSSIPYLLMVIVSLFPAVKSEILLDYFPISSIYRTNLLSGTSKISLGLTNSEQALHKNFETISLWLTFGCILAFFAIAVMSVCLVTTHKRIWKSSWMHTCLIPILLFPFTFSAVYTTRAWRPDDFKGILILVSVFNVILVGSFYGFVYEYANFDTRNNVYHNNLVRLWALRTNHSSLNSNRVTDKADNMTEKEAKREIDRMVMRIKGSTMIYFFLCVLPYYIPTNAYLAPLFLALEILAITVAGRAFAPLVKTADHEGRSVSTKIVILNTFWGITALLNLVFAIINVVLQYWNLNFSFIHPDERLTFMEGIESALIVLTMFILTVFMSFKFSAKDYDKFEHENGYRIRQALTQFGTSSTEMTAPMSTKKEAKQKTKGKAKSKKQEHDDEDETDQEQQSGNESGSEDANSESEDEDQTNQEQQSDNSSESEKDYDSENDEEKKKRKGKNKATKQNGKGSR